MKHQKTTQDSFFIRTALALAISVFLAIHCAPKLNNPNDPASPDFLATQLIRSALNGSLSGLNGGSTATGVKFVAVGLSGQIWTSADASAASWTDVSPGTTTNSLNAIAYSGSKFVAVGGNGQVCTSTNASAGSWTCFGEFASANMNRIIYANGLFVAIGNSGNIWSSASGDGGSWTNNATGSANNLRGILHDGSRFIVVGDSNTECTSTTATAGSWTCAGALGAGAVPFYGITQSAGLYVAVGTNGTSNGIISSASGNTGTFADASGGAMPALRDVTYANGKFVAVGSAGAVKWDADGAPPWSDASIGGTDTLYGITFGQSLFVKVGGTGLIRTSADALSWLNVSPGGNTLLGIVAVP